MSDTHKKYKWIGMVLSDGDRFEYQAEEPGENPWNPSGVAIGTFNHKNYIGWVEVNENE